MISRMASYLLVLFSSQITLPGSKYVKLLFQSQQNPYADKIGLYREPTGGAGIPYQLDIWEDLSTFPAAWNIIETDSNGVITAITQINTISDPTCP